MDVARVEGTPLPRTGAPLGAGRDGRRAGQNGRHDAATVGPLPALCSVADAALIP